MRLKGVSNVVGTLIRVFLVWAGRLDRMEGRKEING
jgi:hypothetical protein